LYFTIGHPLPRIPACVFFPSHVREIPYSHCQMMGPGGKGSALDGSIPIFKFDSLSGEKQRAQSRARVPHGAVHGHVTTPEDLRLRITGIVLLHGRVSCVRARERGPCSRGSLPMTELLATMPCSRTTSVALLVRMKAGTLGKGAVWGLYRPIR
jgi:hypothetical protein